MGANEARHVLDMTHDLARVLALELYTAAQALDLRRDMINAARELARRSDAEQFAGKIGGSPTVGSASREAFLAEAEGLRQELANSPEFAPSPKVGAALAALRERIAFMTHDRAMHRDIEEVVGWVEARCGAVCVWV